MQNTGYSSANTIRTVAAREITVALRNKSILITLAVLTIATLGAIGFLSWKSSQDDGEGAPTVVVVGVDKQALEAGLPAESTGSIVPGKGGPADKPLDISTASSRDEAIQQVKDGKDAALIAANPGYELISDGRVDQRVQESITTALVSLGQREALAKVNVAPEAFRAALPDTSMRTTNLKEEESSVNMAAVVTVLVGVGIMSYFIILFAGNIGARVTEEKSSRIVEILLASVRPIDFLAGKLIGNALVGFAATLIVLSVGTIGVLVTGLADGLAFDFATVPLLLIAFLLGLLFFGGLYAAAGSLISRTEDLQSAGSPVLLLLLGMVYAPFIGMTKMDSTVMQVLAWIPPFSLTTAPLEYAAGNLGLLGVVASFALAALVTAGALALVAKIYRYSILHNGSKLTWREALKQS
ncbi:ABC transporter permease [Corynebacterium heidelbergense]|uniref:ABC transporter permease n=1 Tax=Corynebacterium heidelbergense TaxID=2055947 RepID=A0A364VCI4_9CORY|nr:ABC transporter permease [Corynebacterium heidelbergense]RAV34276.1 ABC transporter permease [Corynebacterium heidelbergense]WCZ36002.1 ABC-2 family transporter protein [Corynebacterium heidelbergense]